MSLNRGRGKHTSGLDAVHLAEFTGADDLLHAFSEWVVSVVEGFHHHQATACEGLVGGLCDAFGFSAVGGEGFLAQYVFARIDGVERPLCVQSVGQRHIHTVYLRVG